MVSLVNQQEASLDPAQWLNAGTPEVNLNMTIVECFCNVVLSMFLIYLHIISCNICTFKVFYRRSHVEPLNRYFKGFQTAVICDTAFYTHEQSQFSTITSILQRMSEYTSRLIPVQYQYCAKIV